LGRDIEMRQLFLYNVFEEEPDPIIQGIICLESATYFLGTSNFPPCPLVMYAFVDEKVDAWPILLIPTKEMDYTDTKELSKGVFVTNEYRTTYELIKFDRSPEEIMFSVEHLKDIDEGLVKSRAYMAERGVLDKFNEWAEISQEVFYMG
jgi:hypothetical protein